MTNRHRTTITIAPSGAITIVTEPVARYTYWGPDTEPDEEGIAYPEEPTEGTDDFGFTPDEDFEVHAAQAMAADNDEDEDEPEEGVHKVTLTATVTGASDHLIEGAARSLLHPLAEEHGATITSVRCERRHLTVQGTLPKSVTGLRGVYLAEAISNEVSDLPLPSGVTLSDLKVEVL